MIELAPTSRRPITRRIVGSHTAQMIQGNSGATPVKEMRRPGTPWRGQPFAVSHSIFMAFSGKRYESWAERSALSLCCRALAALNSGWALSSGTSLSVLLALKMALYIFAFINSGMRPARAQIAWNETVRYAAVVRVNAVLCALLRMALLASLSSDSTHTGAPYMTIDSHTA